MPVFGYYPTTNRNTPKSGQPVCVSVVFNPAGAFKPIAFGLEIDGMRYRYIIKSITSTKDNRGIFSFNCTYIDFGLIKAVLLVFDAARCTWTVG